MGKRDEHLRTISRLLEQHGQTEALAELQHMAEIVASSEASTKRCQRELDPAEKAFHLFFSHHLDAATLFDPQSGCILDVNRAWEALYGYTRDEALAMTIADVGTEAVAKATSPETLKRGDKVRIDLRWHRAKNGRVFPVEITGGNISFEGRPIVYGVSRDITESLHAEQALRRSEASFRALIESMPDGVIVHREGAIVYMSPSARAMLGYGLEDGVAGVPVMDIVHHDYRDIVRARVDDVLRRGGTSKPLEQRLLRRDNTSIAVEIHAMTTTLDGKAAVLAIVRDITVRKEIEAQLVMNDRLASLGRLSASVGHELNNPLAYVLGNVTLMEREIARAQGIPKEFLERLASHIGIVKEGASRMRDIVHDLKTLARADDERRAIDVQQMLDVCINMADHEIRSRARVVRDYRDKVVVSGVEARLGQVFLNLIVNAAQAIPEGRPEANEVRIVVRAAHDGGAVIEVRDTGMGIEPGDLGHVFEPFFTTKTGVGTGLGLSISHRIVTAAGGTITVESTPGQGAMFRVALPPVETFPPTAAS